MTLHIKAKPNSREDRLFYDAAGQLCVKIAAPAHEGLANARLRVFLARCFGVAPSAVRVLAGLGNVHKKIDLDADPAAVEAVLQTLRG